MNLQANSKSTKLLTLPVMTMLLFLIAFAAGIMVSIFINIFQVNQAKIDAIILAKQSNLITHYSFTTDQALSELGKEINENLSSINAALKLEETIALLGVFVTISTIAIPFIMYFNLNKERNELHNSVTNAIQKIIEKKSELENKTLLLEKKIEDYIQDDNKKIEEEIEFLKSWFTEHSEQEISNKIQRNTLKRNKIVTNIYATKSIYITDQHNKNNSDFDDVIMTAQTFELKLFKLMSNKDIDIENSFAWMRQTINHRDIFHNMEYINQLYNTIIIMQSSDYFQHPIHKTLCEDFLMHLGKNTPK